jgi:hypothetical protein
VNVKGRRIGPAEYDRNDGWSPGSTIVVRVPGLDTPAALARNRLVSLADMSRAYARRQRVVLLDARTGRRQLIWAELDSAATAPANVNVLIHPGRNLREGHRYVLALRDLRDAGGGRLSAPSWFARLQADGPLPRRLRGQRARYARIFRTLSEAGIRRRSLYLAWDFTVMSRKSLTSRLLHIRNDAFRRLGDRDLADGRVAGRAPSYRIDQVEDFTEAENPELLRRVTGTLTVPCYLDRAGCPPGARYRYGSSRPDALPAPLPGNVQRTRFVCNIPRAARTSPAHVSLYGHGLLGAPTEINAGNVQDMSAEHDFMFCATSWSGMAREDIPNAIAVLSNLDEFPSLADRLQQGVLNMLLLGRLMHHPHGLAAHPAFRDAGGRALIDPSRLFYDGNSQGGIMGGITTAVAPDFRRAVLGVNGMDYGGLLLQRSLDFDAYLAILRTAYPDESIRPLLFDLIQQLWDRGEADGYAAHMTERALPRTPTHRVLMQVGFGDHQVTNYAADVEARTIGARLYRPTLDAGRIPDRRIGYGLARIPGLPFAGSALVYWDSGPAVTPTPPLENLPNRGGEDPHEHVRSTPAARVQKSRFLLEGRVYDVCGGRPCHTSAFAP